MCRGKIKYGLPPNYLNKLKSYLEELKQKIAALVLRIRRCNQRFEKHKDYWSFREIRLLLPTALRESS